MPQNFNDFYANQFALQDQMVPTVPSLAQQKTELLAKRKQQKVASLDPEAAADESARAAYAALYGSANSGSSNIIDAAQSSFAQTAGNLADMGYNIADRISEASGGTPFARDSKLGQYINKLSDEDFANKEVGYDPTSYNQAMQSINNDVVNGNYLSAFGTSIANMPETVARSAAPVAELAVGAALAPATSGASLFGVIGHLATKAPKVAKALSNAYSAYKAATIYGMDQANQYATAYEKETGHKMSASEVAGNTMLATAIGATEINIFKGAAEANTLGTFVQTTKDLIKATNPTKSVGKVIVGNVVNNTLKVLGTGGAEAAQEYLETWHGILASSDKPLADQLADQVNKNKALTGAIVGFGTGGSMTAIPAAASMATVGTAGTASKAVRSTLNYGNEKLTAAQYKALSQEERDSIQKDHAERQKVYDNTLAINKQAINNISNATSIDELQAYEDPEITKAIDIAMGKEKELKALRTQVNEANSIEEIGKGSAELTGRVDQIISSNQSKTPYSLEEVKSLVNEQLNNYHSPEDLDKNIDKIKNQAIAQYNSKNTALKLAMEAERAKDVVGKVSSNLYEGTKKYAEKILPRETRDAIVEQAKKGVDLAKDGLDLVVDEAKNLNKSTARAIIDDIANGKVNKALNNFSSEQLNDLKQGFKGNEKAQRVLDKVIKTKSKVKQDFAGYLDKSKDMSFFDKVVDASGKVAKTNLAAKMRGLAVMTREQLKDSDTLTRYKNLVKSLEEDKKKDPESFSKQDQARLEKAYRNISIAKEDGAQGLINDAIDKLSKEYKDRSPEAKKLFKDAIKKVKAYSKVYTNKAKTKWTEADVEAKINEKIDTLDKKLSEISENGPKTKTLTKVKKATPAETNLEDVDFSAISKDSLDKILDKVGGVNGLAQMVASKQIEELQVNPDPELMMLSFELQEAKGNLPTEDAEVSENPDKPMSAKDMQNSSKQLDNFVEKICKGK